MSRGTDQLCAKELVQCYLSGEATTSLATRHGVSVGSVIVRLRDAGVLVQNKSHKRHFEAPLIPEYTAQEILDGLLLGDGGIAKKGYAQMEQCSRRKGWLLDVQDRLHLTGVESRIILTPPRERTLKESGRVLRGTAGRHLYTPVYMELKEQRQRWYPEGVKLVPRDLRLTPMVLAQWFCGDGSGNSNGTLVFHTEGFSETCVDFLIGRLWEDCRIHGSKQKHQRPGQFFIQILNRSDAVRFRDLTSVYVPECCQYKLRFVRETKHPHLFPEQVLEIRNRALAGESHQVLAKDFGKSIQAIRTLLRGASFVGLVPTAYE